jgi:hypothetical protein
LAVLVKKIISLFYMIQSLPIYISIVFLATTILTFYFFVSASTYKKTLIFVCSAWLILQGFISYSLFYTDTISLPPRILLNILPPFLCVLFLFLSTKGKLFVDSFSQEKLTILQCVRLPVELVLFWLFQQKMLPEIMTFEGRNFDVLSGISAPLIYYFGFVKNILSKKVILIWNYCCLALLLNIVITAVLSAPLPIQQLAFDQPNIAVLYFPFTFLPGFIVPIVLFSHLVVISKITRNNLRN